MSNPSKVSYPAASVEESRDGLVDSLFADSQTIIPGSVVTALACFLCAFLEHSVTAWSIGLVTILVTCVRLRLVHSRQARGAHPNGLETHQYERVYVFGATGYLLCNGAFACWAMTAASDSFVLMLALFVALTNALSIAVRNFAIRYGVGLQVAAVTIPLGVGFAVRGGWFIVFAGLVARLAMFIYTSSTRLRNILLSEIAYRKRSDSIAGQFDFAINNMSHGMCMISSDRKIQVANGKFAEFFGLGKGRSIVGSPFKALLRLATRGGMMSSADCDRLMEAFSSTDGVNEETSLQIETTRGVVCDLTIKHNSNGGWVLVVQDVTEKKQAERVIDYMARFDAVTNLRNRRSFETALTDALAEAGATGVRTEVLFIDLDGFKQINDTLGHKVGDRVLAAAGARLGALAGPNDMVARWGGDEFVVLRRRRNGVSDVEVFTAELIRELSRPSMIDGTEVIVGASVGIAVSDGGQPPMDQMLQQADMALYVAKREGRGSFRVYEESMTENAMARRLLELDLQAAVAARSFDLHYQPIVNLETRDIVSFEALARWRHPTRGQVSPGLFVPVLEELNLMNAFGAWALQRACADAMQWPSHVRVGVNVSTKQLESDLLLEAVERALKSSGLCPNRLEIEITETALLGGSDIAEKTLERVRALGVRIALDDFGTGFSSLSHLMRLPLDKVKIDQSFTRQLGRDRKADVLVENIARLSHQLGMVVTVEGVETREQYEQIKSLGAIGEGQGYLFSRPLPMEGALALFKGDARQNVA